MTALLETPSRIEPCLLEQTSPELVDLIATLAAAAERIGARLHPRTAASLADLVLESVLLRGELARGEVDRMTGLSERTARTLLSTLISDGILGSDTPKGPVSLRFPLHAVERLFPRLFPET